MTIEQFGQSIQEKYPEYKDMSAADLGQKMLTKYPQYQDLVQSGDTQTTDTFLEGHPVLKGISDLVGTTGLAKGVAQSIFLKFTPEGKDVQKMLDQGKVNQDQFNNIISGLVTPKQVIGSAIQTGTTLATAGLNPANAPTAIGRIGQTAAKLGGLSAISGGAQAFGQGATANEIGKQAVVAGGTGMVLGGVGQAIGELATYLSSPKITEGIYNKALGVSKRTVEKGRSPSGMLAEEGIMGTKSGMLTKSQDIANQSEKQVSSIIENNPQKFNSDEILNNIKSALQDKFPNTLSSKDIGDIVEKLPLNALRTNAELLVKTLDNLRSELDNKFLGNGKWLNDSTAEKIIGLKTAANVLRDIVQNTDSRLPPIFSRYSNAITAIRSLSSELAKPHIMTNLLEILGSMIYGGATGGLTPEGVKNSLEAFGVAKGVTSAPFLTGGAQALSKVGSIAGGLGKVAKVFVPGISKTLSNTQNP